MAETTNKTSKRDETRDRGGLYRTMVSIKTSLVFLGVFAFLFFVGTVFPQNSDPDRLDRYRDAGGKFVALVGGLDLLDLFHSWYFTLAASLFALHLLLCSIHRLGVLRKRPKFGLFTRESLLHREHSFSVSNSADGTGPDIEKTLKRMGFRRLRYYSEDANVKRVVSEKGIPFRWVSWAYHLCILVAIGGFCVTYLLAFEDSLTIAAGERKAVPLNSPTTAWRRLTRLLGHPAKLHPKHVEVELESFVTEYTQKPTLQYPDEPANRLSAAWGLRGQTVGYKLTGDSLYPRDWFSRLKVYEDGRLVAQKRIEVNDPLRYAGLTFYQEGYEYKFDLRIGTETLNDILADKPFTVLQMEGEFRVRTPRVGTLYGYDGTVAPLSPSAKLQYRPPAGEVGRKWSTVAELPLGRPVEAMRAQMTLTNLRESSVLSYRYDPAVPPLWVSTTFLMILMALRIYMPWYQVRCHVDSLSGRSLITVSIRMVGLFARPERVKQKLCDAFNE